METASSSSKHQAAVEAFIVDSLSAQDLRRGKMEVTKMGVRAPDITDVARQHRRGTKQYTLHWEATSDS